MQLFSRYSNPDKTGLLLVLISSVLLGIWATMHTIALRNILLGFGGLLALWIWINWFKDFNGNSHKRRPSLLASSPLVLVCLMLLWVVTHFLFFSTDPVRQWDELTSTWLRALAAVLIGSATGLVLIRKISYLPWLWTGLLMSFIVLIGQYIPKALQRHSIFGVDFFADYIYWAKFSGVLAGTILIAGLLGLLIDYFRVTMSHATAMYDDLPAKMASFRIPAYVFFGVFITTYSFVFVFDAKAGVGMAIILIFFWILVGVVFLGGKIFSGNNQINALGSYLKLTTIFFLIALIFSFLALKHVKNNPGWESLFEDIAISSQIDKFPNWQNPSKFGLPLRSNGTQVAGNTYERVSWGVVGLRLIELQPLGSGILRSFPIQARQLAPGFDSAAYTHSGWIDLGLAFGIPGLLLIPIALLIAMVRATLGLSSGYKATIITISLALLVLYSVGEYGFQHGIEILFYLGGLLGGLSLIPKNDQQNLE